MGEVKRQRLYFCSSSLLKECLRGGHLPEDGEDRISSLPDEILLLILSFLKFNEMAQTSLLSRRWLSLWMDTQVLHLDYPVTNVMELPSDEESQCFVNRVNHFLKLHRSQSLKEFRITFGITFILYGQHKKDISSWVEYALARKVESLELNFHLEVRSGCYVSYAFDFDEFLKLDIEKGVHIANPDKRLAFRSLKSLSLKSVQVTNEAVDFILQNCPFLERLEVVGSVELDSLVISDPKLVLKYLHIDLCSTLEFVSISNINLASLNIMLDSKMARGLRLRNLPMLVELSLWKSGGRDELRRVISQSSCCLSQLRSLRITVLDLKDITQLSELSRLTKLKRLVINVTVRDNERLIELVSFMKAYPYLEEFGLVLTRLKVKIFIPNRTVAQPETCSLKCLKVFEFAGYSGRDEDLELVTDIMKNSVALKKIVIDPRNPPKLYSYFNRTVEEEEECRSTAMQQFEGFRESTQPRIIIL